MEDSLILAHLEAFLLNNELEKNLRTEYLDTIAKIDDMDINDLKSLIRKYNIVSPNTKNSLSDPIHFNLMFSTTIGCSHAQQGLLRPETAQGIFVNFKRLLDLNNGRLPMVAAQVGVSFRNEISPRAGLLRCREFLMAEIEHFVHPSHKTHPRFGRVAALMVRLCPASENGNLPAIELTLAEAVGKGLIANDILAYYIGRTFQFLATLGMDMSRVRFRQHLRNEMAHYACDCWDCEILTFHGWVECVGCADRACYDLVQHSAASGHNLTAQQQLSVPTNERVHELVLDKAVIGRTFREKSKAVISHLEAITTPVALDLHQDLLAKSSHELNIEDTVYVLEQHMIKSLTFRDRDVFTEDVYPHVIEPSFGIGRILYSLLCHCCMVRANDPQRVWFDLPASIAPIKCLVLPLSNKKEFRPLIDALIDQLAAAEISYRLDDLNASIGKRYARGDELGVPFAVTVDFASLNSIPPTVTLRERNTTQQVRLELQYVGRVVHRLVRGKMSWTQVVETHGLFLT